MAVINIPWTTGSGNITLTYTGEGNDTVIVSSTENEGKDRSIPVSVNADNVPSRSVTVSQVGRRQNIILSGGGVFKASGNEFLVLKP